MSNGLQSGRHRPHARNHGEVHLLRASAIQEARISTKTDGRKEFTGEGVLTACQQTCPADAIAFGNINDPNIKVPIKKQDAITRCWRSWTKPRTTYLARLRIPIRS
jgi:molybdopterin-containing oxidoreductase family iron-sulfur binding subunit